MQNSLSWFGQLRNPCRPFPALFSSRGQNCGLRLERRPSASTSVGSVPGNARSPKPLRVRLVWKAAPRQSSALYRTAVQRRASARLDDRPHNQVVEHQSLHGIGVRGKRARTSFDPLGQLERLPIREPQGFHWEDAISRANSVSFIRDSRTASRRMRAGNLSPRSISEEMIAAFLE